MTFLWLMYVGLPAIDDTHEHCGQETGLIDGTHDPPMFTRIGVCVFFQRAYTNCTR